MASRKQIRGAGPRESPFRCFVPWTVLAQNTHLFSCSPVWVSSFENRLIKHLPWEVPAGPLPTGLWSSGAASTRVQWCSAQFPLRLKTGKERSRPRGLCLPMEQGLQTIWFVYNQQAGGEWTSLWCGRRHKSRAHDCQAWQDFSREVGLLWAPSPVKNLSQVFVRWRSKMSLKNIVVFWAWYLQILLFLCSYKN